MLEPIPFAGYMEIDEMNADTLLDDGYEKFTKEGLLISVRKQKGEIESLLVQLESMLKFINERGENRAFIIWKAQEK